jgi:hypothetical protein
VPTVRTAARRPAAACGRPGPRPARRRTTRSRPRVPLPRRRRRPAGWQKWWPAALVVAAVFVGIAWQTTPAAPPAAAAPGRCTVVRAGYTLTLEQATNAKTIAAVARARRLPARAVAIAIATAMQESHLRNLRYGDRDSLGLFQQRPSQGWGTPAQILDPAYAAGRFFDHLVRIHGWQTARLTTVAQAVQRSAAPEAYQKWEPMATTLATALSSARVDCPS